MNEIHEQDEADDLRAVRGLVFGLPIALLLWAIIIGAIWLLLVAVF